MSSQLQGYLESSGSSVCSTGFGSSVQSSQPRGRPQLRKLSVGAAAASSPVLYSFDFIVFHRVLVQSLVGFLALGTTFLNAGPDFFLHQSRAHSLCLHTEESFRPGGSCFFCRHLYWQCVTVHKLTFSLEDCCSERTSSSPLLARFNAFRLNHSITLLGHRRDQSPEH